MDKFEIYKSFYRTDFRSFSTVSESICLNNSQIWYLSIEISVFTLLSLERFSII
jgi:hypothetical protein